MGRAAELQRFKKESKREAKEFFSKAPRDENALNIRPSMPSAAFAKLTRKLMCRHTSLLVQLHTKQTPIKNRESYETHMYSMWTGR